ncbi:MAG: 6-phosphogluconate dehydrogenase [Mucilaginibacter sp.]|jgi:3-hydroxyisobutyrate dehydrogenase-like beta-hydroxyacid dehydrogenase|nr:6-phosphogluconate dehydrogenase [Mucilaginibacter sp.]
MEKKIGFIGLGSMGLNMAKNLVEQGYYLQVYNRTASKVDALEQNSVTKCKTPAEAAEGVQAVITMLADDEAVTEIVTGDDGVLKTLRKDGVHISMSTISPEVAAELAEKHAVAGSRYVASPVFGRPEAAAAKKLWICISGSQQAKDIARPILECLGQGIYDFGEKANGANIVKIAGNFMIMASLEMMAEAYTMAEKNGLDRLKVAEFFGSTLFSAPIFQNYGKTIANKQYKPVGFTAKLGLKDARLAFKLSQQSETPMPFVSTIHGRLLSAVAKGWSETDWAEGISRGVTEDAGL